MANLKDDLDQYLLLQSDQKKKFNVKVPQIKVPEFGKIFSRNTEPEANSWLKDTQDSCYPKLVIIYISFTYGYKYFHKIPYHCSHVYNG